MTVVEGQVDESTVAVIEEMAEAAHVADGVSPLGEQPLRALRSPHNANGNSSANANNDDDDNSDADDEVRHLLSRDPEGALAGYAQVAGAGAEATAELVVVPSHRRRGVGTDLLHAVLTREPGAAVWAHGDLPAAQRLARRVGLERTRELLMMRRTGSHGPTLAPTSAPEGIELGTLAEAKSEGGARWSGMDARAEFLRVNNAAFHWHPEQGGWTLGQLEERLAVDWVDLSAVFLAVDVSGEQPRLAGFHWTKTVPAAAGGETEGEVYVVAVDPADQGRGLGGVLTTVGVDHLEGPVGAQSVVLYVEGDNTPARRTYERLGFAVEHVDATYATPVIGN